MLFGLEPHVVAKISLEAPRRRFQDCRDFEVSLLIGQLPGSDLRQARIVRRKHRPRTSPVEGIVRTSLDPAGARRTRTHSAFDKARQINLPPGSLTLLAA